MWQSLSQFKIECGPRMERMFHMGAVGLTAVGGTAVNMAEKVSGPLPVLPALAIVGFLGGAATWFQSRATAKLNDSIIKLNHDLTRAFRQMVLTRLPMEHQKAAKQAWPVVDRGPALPEEVKDSMGPALAALLGHLGRLEPSDQDPLPELPWGDPAEWARFLGELSPGCEAMANEFHLHALLWFLYEVRYDTAATAALDQYMSAATLARIEELGQTSEEAIALLRSLSTNVRDLEEAVKHGHLQVLEHLSRIEGYFTGFKSVAKLLDNQKDTDPDRLRALIKGPTWRDVEERYVFERRLVGPLRECLSGKGFRIFPISAPSGAGKSTFLMWAAVWCQRDLQLPTFYCEDAGEAQVPDGLPKNAILVIDHASRLRPNPKEFLEHLSKTPFEGVLIVADQDVCWAGEGMSALTDEQSPLQELGGLDEHEKARLKSLLDRSESEHWLSLGATKKKEVLNSTEHGELLVVLILAITDLSLRRYVENELANLKDTCKQRDVDFTMIRDAIIAVSWYGIGDESCPQGIINNVVPGLRAEYLAVAESILLGQPEGQRRNRHRLFAEAILKSQSMHSRRVLEKLVPDLIRPRRGIRMVLSDTVVSLQLMYRCLEHWGGDANVLYASAARATTMSAESGFQILERAFELGGRDVGVLKAAARASAMRGEKGFGFLEQAFELGGRDLSVLNAAAKKAAMMGEKGLPVLRKAVQLGDRNPEILRTAARASAMTGETRLWFLELAFELGERDLWVLRAAARRAAMMGEKGLPVLRKVFEFGGRNPEILKAAAARFRCGSYPEVQILIGILGLCGDDSYVLEAVAYAAGTHKVGGKLVLKSALRRAKNDQDVQFRLLSRFNLARRRSSKRKRVSRYSHS